VRNCESPCKPHRMKRNGNGNDSNKHHFKWKKWKAWKDNR
jgi:hypothetical protein